MGRNKRKNRPAGFDIGECWGDIFKYPENHSASTEAAAYLAKHGGANGGPMVMRQMVKPRQIEEGSQFHVEAMLQIERLKSYGCGIELVIDLHNRATGRGDYHARIEWPRRKTLAQHTRDLVRDFEPDEVECMNEFWYTKGPADMRMVQYRNEVVFKVAEGLTQANLQYEPRLNASIVLDAQDSPHDLWVWNVEWDNCLEVYHWNILSHRGKPPTPNTPEGLLAKLQAQDYCDKDRTGRDKAVGWVWPLKLNETSPVGDRVDLNTRNGAEMMLTLLRHQKRYDMPVTMLTMGGSRAFDDEGGWGMQSNFVDDRGNLSLGVQAWLDFVGAAPYEGPSEPPVDPPVDPPGQSGWDEHLAEAQEDLDKAVKRGPSRRGVKSAERVIRHTEEAIGSTE
jgi:hypothetical protein